MSDKTSSLNAVLTAILKHYPRAINPASRSAVVLAVAASLSLGTGHAAPMPDTFQLSELDGNNGFICPETMPICSKRFMTGTDSTTASSPHWNGLGPQGYGSPETSTMRLLHHDDCERSFCDLDQAVENDLLWNSFYRFNGSDYVLVSDDTTQGFPDNISYIWQPWDGFWSPVLRPTSSNPLFLFIPAD